VPEFERGREVVTREPLVTVDAGLPPGRYRFQLVVEDGGGNRSRPATLTVLVEQRSTGDPTRPTR
jgi:hypothetical protein